MVEIPAGAWFTQVSYRNAASPLHPDAADLEPNNRMKREQVLDWIVERVRGKRVLDLFCANGAFSFEAARAGAKEVVGLDFSSERVRCAEFIASTLDGAFSCVPSFTTGNVYELTRIFRDPFDVVLALGGLYHVADPPHVLTQIRALALEALIVQTSSILPLFGNWARFVIREDQTARGLTSIVGGRGVWRYSVQCFENILSHANFRVVKSRRPPALRRRRFPWYSALAIPF